MFPELLDISELKAALRDLEQKRQRLIERTPLSVMNQMSVTEKWMVINLALDLIHDIDAYKAEIEALEKGGFPPVTYG